MRRAQKVAVADKKKTPKMCVCGGGGGVLAVGNGVAQDHIILQNALVACCLEIGAATTTASIFTPTFAQEIGAMDFACVSVASYIQGASIFNAASGGAEKLAEEQLNLARA